MHIVLEKKKIKLCPEAQVVRMLLCWICMSGKITRYKSQKVYFDNARKIKPFDKRKLHFFGILKS